MAGGNIRCLRNPQPATRNPQPATRNPQPATRNPQPATRNPQPADGCRASPVRSMGSRTKGPYEGAWARSWGQSVSPSRLPERDKACKFHHLAAAPTRGGDHGRAAALVRPGRRDRRPIAPTLMAPVKSTTFVRSLVSGIGRVEAVCPMPTSGASPEGAARCHLVCGSRDQRSLRRVAPGPGGRRVWWVPPRMATPSVARLAVNGRRSSRCRMPSRRRLSGAARRFPTVLRGHCRRASVAGRGPWLLAWGLVSQGGPWAAVRRAKASLHDPPHDRTGVQQPLWQPGEAVLPGAGASRRSPAQGPSCVDVGRPSPPVRVQRPPSVQAVRRVEGASACGGMGGSR